MGAHVINVAPRYTAGSPAAVTAEIAERVVQQEMDAYAHEADERGLSLIVFEMFEIGSGWIVHDWLTGELHFWPFTAKCPHCTRKTHAQRGILNQHGCTSAYVGRGLREDERWKYSGRFWRTPKDSLATGIHKEPCNRDHGVR